MQSSFIGRLTQLFFGLMAASAIPATLIGAQAENDLLMIYGLFAFPIGFVSFVTTRVVMWLRNG